MTELKGWLADCTSEEMKSELNKDIELFLSERRESEQGGFSLVTDKDRDIFGDIINKLIMLKWESDADNDFPIEFKMIDRTRFQRMHYMQVPYLPIVPTLRELLKARRIIDVNLDIAFSAKQNLEKSLDLFFDDLVQSESKNG